MATMLEDYLIARGKLEGKLATRTLSSTEIWQYQELLYRIAALETCSMLSQMAPIGTDPQLLSMHYQMSDAYIQCLLQERKFGTHEEARKPCQTAFTNLELIVQDYRKRFGSFAPQTAEQYKKEITKTIGATLTAWITYRDILIPIRRTTT